MLDTLKLTKAKKLKTKVTEHTVASVISWQPCCYLSLLNKITFAVDYNKNKENPNMPKLFLAGQPFKKIIWQKQL